MEDLKTMLDKGMPIAEINQKTNEFIHSADGYPDKLKLVSVLLNLIQEGNKLLSDVDLGDFISKISDRVNKLNRESKNLKETYGVHLEQNDKIIKSLTNEKSNDITDIQQQIKKLLSEYDAIIKELVESRDKLPIEKQLEQEKE